MHKPSQKEKEFQQRIFELVCGRVLKNLYYHLSEKSRQHMEKVFESGSVQEQRDFMEAYLPNFDQLYWNELERVAHDLDEELRLQHS